MNTKALAIGVIMLVIIGGIFAIGGSLPKGPFAISGYDGPTATFSDVEWADIQPEDIGNDVTKSVSTTHAEIYPNIPDAYDLLVCTGLRAEIMAAPNVLSRDTVDTVNKVTIEGDTNTTESWDIQKAKCQFSLTITTYEGGLAAIENVIFTIRLESNRYSIFSNYDDAYAYFINVYTRNMVVREGSMTVIPTAASFDFDLNPVGTDATPQWILDSGKLDADAGAFSAVEIPIEV
jgi:hypothetical protein